MCSMPNSESLGRTRHCHEGCIECTAGVISPRMLEEWRENWVSAAQYEIGSDTRRDCELGITQYRLRSGKGLIKASCPSSALARGKIWYPMAAWTFGIILELHICAWIRELLEVVTWYIRFGQDCFKDQTSSFSYNNNILSCCVLRKSVLEECSSVVQSVRLHSASDTWHCGSSLRFLTPLSCQNVRLVLIAMYPPIQSWKSQALATRNILPVAAICRKTDV